MNTTQRKPARWLAATGIGVVAAWTLASCAGGPPELPEISDSAQASMAEATSFTYTRTDPEGVHGDEIAVLEWSGQTTEPNHLLMLETPQGTLEYLVVDESETFLKLEAATDTEDEAFDLPGAEGMWVQAPDSEVGEVLSIEDDFASTAGTAFELIDNLSDEELDTVESEEIELDGQSVYKYTVPATATNDTDLYTGSETVAFYFLKETSELVQVDATTGENTATHAFTDLNSVELFEAPADDDIADLEWAY